MIGEIFKKSGTKEVIIKANFFKACEERCASATVTMKYLISLVVLCTAIFVTLDAAPVLPSGYEAEFEAVGRQQSDEMAKTFLNVFTKILSAAGDRIGRDGSIQADDELGKTFLNVVSSLLSAMGKKADPNDKLQQTFFNGFNSILSSIGKRLDEGGEIQSDDEMTKTIMNLVGTLFSAMTKKIDSGEIQSADEIMPAFLNLFSNALSLASKKVDPKDDVAKSVFNGFNTLLSAFGRQFNSGGGSQIQSDNGLPGAFLNILGTLGSALQKEASPKDELAQPFFTLFNTILSAAKNKVGEGGAQEVHVDTLPTYTAKRFDQSMLMESVNKNAAMVEGDMDLSEEAKTQLWGAILSSLASSALSKFLDG